MFVLLGINLFGVNYPSGFENVTKGLEIDVCLLKKHVPQGIQKVNKFSPFWFVAKLESNINLDQLCK